LSLPSTAKAATSVQPTTLPTSASDRLPSVEAKGNDNGAVLQLTSNRPATQPSVDELLAPVSGDVIELARVERNRNVPAPAPSLSTTSVSSSLRTESASPVSAIRAVPQLSQKIPDNTSVTSSPASANLPSQGRNIRSTSPGHVGVAQVSPSQIVPTPQVEPPVQTSASVSLFSTSSGQNEPKPPRRRQSSGLDLQVARQKKLMAAKVASGTQKSGTTQASPGAGPSPSTKDGTATATISPTSTTTAGIPNTPAALTSTPAVPAAAQATPAQSPGTSQGYISVITTSVSNTASQPQMVQTPSPTLVHRDLRQGFSRVRTSVTSPRTLRITDRAPAPAPEPGSSSAPIVIDEEDVSMSTPADESIDVDALLQPSTQTEETPMALDSDPQNVQGSNADAKDDQHDQEGKALLAENSVEGLGHSNNDILSGATIVPSLGNESPILSKDSTQSAVGVIHAPKGKDTEMTPPAPTTIASTAVALEPSAAPDHSTISAQSVDFRSSSPGTVTLGVRPQEEKGSSKPSVDPSLPMGQAVSQTPSISSGRASVSTPLGRPAAPHSSIASLSDMDISSTSDTPPIAVLGTRASISRSPSLQSGTRFSEGGTELAKVEEIEEDASEMVDELAPLFGKDMKVICMDRAYDVPGEFTWDFTLSHADWVRVSQWAKAPESLEYVSRPSFVLSKQAYP